MSLEVLYRGRNNTWFDLAPSGFTQQNYIDGTTVNDLLATTTPIGVLGGSVAGIHGDMLVGKGNEDNRPMGFFLNDAKGKDFDNDSAAASGKGVFVSGNGSLLKVDVYETHTEDGLTALTYAAGDPLYASINGFLTKESPGGGNDVDTHELAMVVGAPTSDDPSLTILTWI